MSIVKGLKAIANASSGGGAYLRIKDGDNVPLWFLQELDEGSPNYNEKAGIGFVAVEHKHPDKDKFKLKALCTADEGGCWPCEQGWSQKQNLYINVLADYKGEEKVYILTQGLGGSKTFVSWLLDFAGDAETITNQKFKFKRTGSGQYDTTYSLMPSGAPDKEPRDPTQYDLFDLEKVAVRHVPYEAQEQYFGGAPESPDEDEDEPTDRAW